MSMNNKVYWTGKTTCDICNKPCTTHLVDGNINGRWGVCHISCYKGSFGTGLGQLYTKQEDGTWLKTVG